VPLLIIPLPLIHRILVWICLFQSRVDLLPPQLFLKFQLPLQLVIILIHRHFTRLQLLLPLYAREATPFILIILV
jgi:hypothetical protein